MACVLIRTDEPWLPGNQTTIGTHTHTHTHTHARTPLWETSRTDDYLYRTSHGPPTFLHVAQTHLCIGTSMYRDTHTVARAARVAACNPRTAWPVLVRRTASTRPACQGDTPGRMASPRLPGRCPLPRAYPPERGRERGPGPCGRWTRARDTCVERTTPHLRD